MIDFNRALTTAWERMTVILFQPFDIAKWSLIGFNAFLALLAEGGVSLNNPIPNRQQGSTTQTYSSLPEVLHAFKDLRIWLGDLPSNPWFKLYVCFVGAYIIIWLVLNWVGCRGEFVFLDNIVRNRGALVEPWKRYAKEGNIWFLFHTGLVMFSSLVSIAGAAVLLALNWTWISAERQPTAGEVSLAVLSILLFVAVALLASMAVFLIRSLSLPLYFKQTMSLASALVAALTLIFTRPLSIALYVLLNLLLAILGGIVICFIALAGCCILACASCYPFIGSLLVSLILCQVILPYLVFMRCFQLGCLEEFGPAYDVFRIDTPTAPPQA